jgi:uncharacterized protein YbjT (DUF2867 family)
MSLPETPHAVLVTGATGKQGGAVFRALAASPSRPTLYAATRNPSSPAAQALLSLCPTAHLLRGDLSSPAALVAALPEPARKPGAWSVYVVTNPGASEVRDAAALIDAAISHGAAHVVLSSVARPSDDVAVAHWRTKVAVEAHLRSAAAAAAASSSGRAVTYTVLRPVFLLDNLAIPGFFGRFSAALWARLGPAPLKVVDPASVGLAAAAALADPASRLYRTDAELALCGDELTFERADGIFREKTGGPMPRTSGWIVAVVLFLMRDFGRMARVLATGGFKADVGSPEAGVEMADFGAWVERSRFAKKDA